ncbi:MAG: NAD+ synthase [Bacteroidales bacterium]|nr:NAD+ synthase [Bacteroidales bacterium]
MKIALAQLNYRVGDFDNNVSRIITAIEKAREGGADIVVFSELSVCGYPPRDFLEFDDFIDRCYSSIHTIASHCNDIAAIVGAPSRNPAQKGKPLYNTAWFLAEGKIHALAHKTLLPNYDVFDEYRYFEPNQLPCSTIDYKGTRFALNICEDLWNVSDNPLYLRNPMDEVKQYHPDIILNIAASPFHYSQGAMRKEILTRNAVTYGCPLVYVNHVGGQTELIFDGGSMLIERNGEITTELKSFEEDFQIVEVLTEKPSGFSGSTIPLRHCPSAIELIHSALVLGIRDYFAKMGFSKAILGLSGGIDSAVTLALAVTALGKENVRAVLLPSQFSSDHSITDARKLAENLEVIYDIISIETAFKSMEITLLPQFKDLPFNLAEENIQARLRGVILMALSNKFGYILLNTSNKSEVAVGYGTLYGDMCGGLSVLGDVYKTQVYELAQWINREVEIIPENSILKPPSAELRPGQKDSDSLPDYPILDKILFQYIELRQGPDELIHNGFDQETVRRVLKLVNTSEYKRFQTPPILRVSPKAFGMGRRIPIVGKYLS